jgi:hypothetical protein
MAILWLSYGYPIYITMISNYSIFCGWTLRVSHPLRSLRMIQGTYLCATQAVPFRRETCRRPRAGVFARVAPGGQMVNQGKVFYWIMFSTSFNHFSGKNDETWLFWRSPLCFARCSTSSHLRGVKWQTTTQVEKRIAIYLAEELSTGQNAVPCCHHVTESWIILITTGWRPVM